MEKNGKQLIQAILDGEHLSDFERVRAHHGINTKADVIRFLIRQEARRVQRMDRLEGVISGWLGGKITADEAMQAIALHPR